MSVQLGDEVPDFTAETTEGTINFHDWIGDGWAVLFSHPKDFTPVCTTELGSVASLQPEFAKRNCKIVGLSVDSVGDHTEWSKDIEEVTGHAVGYPLGAYFDEDFTFSDANGDGIIDVTEISFDLDGDGSRDSTVFLGYPVPRFEVSWNNSFSLFNRRIRVSGLWDYRGGHVKDNLTEAFRCGFNICEGLNDASASLEDQAQAQTRRSGVGTSAGYLEPGWFIKLREISVTFFAPNSWAQSLQLDRMSLTLSGRNLATITDYEGSDPEVEGFSGSFGSRDFLTQPQVRYFTARLNLSF